MNDINEMPPKCQYCPYWEVCKFPWVCPDIGDKKPKRTEKCTETHACDLPEQDIEHCANCIHAADSEDICILRKCKYAIAELKDCYEPKQPDRKQGKWTFYEDRAPVWDIAGEKTWARAYKCSECGFVHSVIEDFGQYGFCPNCGADMRGEQE